MVRFELHPVKPRVFTREERAIKEEQKRGVRHGRLKPGARATLYPNATSRWTFNSEVAPSSATAWKCRRGKLLSTGAARGVPRSANCSVSSSWSETRADLHQHRLARVILL